MLRMVFKVMFTDQKAFEAQTLSSANENLPKRNIVTIFAIVVTKKIFQISPIGENIIKQIHWA